MINGLLVTRQYLLLSLPAQSFIPGVPVRCELGNWHKVRVDAVSIELLFACNAMETLPQVRANWNEPVKKLPDRRLKHNVCVAVDLAL